MAEKAALYLSQALLEEEHNIHQGVHFDRVYWQPAIQMGPDELIYDRGVGMHAPVAGVGYAIFAIPEKTNQFAAIFGHAAQGSNFSFGNGVGRIFIDGVKVWEGDVSHSKRVFQIRIWIPHGARKLRLEVDAKGSHCSSHTTWADAHFNQLCSLKSCDPMSIQ